MSEPNLQNIPIRTELGRRVRKAFVTRPGMLRYCLDYSQAELRVLAHLSQDPLLMKVYHQGLDVHRNTAVEAFGTADKVNGIDMRGVAKTLNFGIPFCITEMGVQRNINKTLPDGVDEIDANKAREYLDSWYAKYQGVDRYRRGLWYQTAQSRGLFWNLFGRPRRVPDICSAEDWKRRAAERKIISSAVQGGAADMVKHSMLACWQYLKSQTDCEAQMVLMIHDDLQFDMAPEGSAKVIRELKGIMESTCQHKLSVPIKVDMAYFTDHWGNKQEMG
jgi:DNA polymerase-1